MQTGEKPLDDRPRLEIDRAEPGDDRRIEVACGARHGSQPAGWNRDRFEQLIDDAIRGDAFGLGVKIRQHAMPEDRLGEGLDVFHRDVMAAV